MYSWAPLAIIGEEINKLDEPVNGQPYTSIAQHDDQELSDTHSPPQLEVTARPFLRNKNEDILPTTGIYLGIWNIFATIPQFLAIFISMVVFSILEPGLSPELAGGGGDDGKGQTAADVSTKGLSGTAVCLAVGAVCAFVGGVKTFRLRNLLR